MHYCIVYCTHYTKFWSALSTQYTANLTHLTALRLSALDPIGTQHSVLLTYTQCTPSRPPRGRMPGPAARSAYDLSYVGVTVVVRDEMSKHC